MLTSTDKRIIWLPRISGIFFILFLSLFSLDIFQPGMSAGEIALGLFMHNIPSFVLAIFLALSWKYEIVGGIGFILAGLLYIVALAMSSRFEWYMLSWALIISGPAFAIGGLFIMNWYKKKRSQSHK